MVFVSESVKAELAILMSALIVEQLAVKANALEPASLMISVKIKSAQEIVLELVMI